MRATVVRKDATLRPGRRKECTQHQNDLQQSAAGLRVSIQAPEQDGRRNGPKCLSRGEARRVSGSSSAPLLA